MGDVGGGLVARGGQLSGVGFGGGQAAREIGGVSFGLLTGGFDLRDVGF